MSAKYVGRLADGNDPEPTAEDYLRVEQFGDYKLGKKLGEGAFAVVRVGTHSVSGFQVACKICCKALIKDDYVRKHLYREAQILQSLKHPNIIQLLETVESETLYVIVMDLCAKDVLTHLCSVGVSSEHQGRIYGRQLLSAFEYLHSKNIVHRDLKAENMMLDRNNNLKIIDFGLSNDMTGKATLSTQCGSMAYSAPELLSSKPYGKEVDIWSIGVCLYVMITGALPFGNLTLTDLHAMMLDGRFDLPNNLSDELKDLFTRFFQVKPTKRITIAEAWAHQWIKGADSDRTPEVEIPPPLCRADLNDLMITQMERMGFANEDEEIEEAVLSNRCNRVTTTYHLLMQKRDILLRRLSRRRSGLERSSSSGSRSSGSKLIPLRGSGERGGLTRRNSSSSIGSGFSNSFDGRESSDLADVTEAPTTTTTTTTTTPTTLSPPSRHGADDASTVIRRRRTDSTGSNGMRRRKSSTSGLSVRDSANLLSEKHSTDMDDDDDGAGSGCSSSSNGALVRSNSHGRNRRSFTGGTGSRFASTHSHSHSQGSTSSLQAQQHQQQHQQIGLTYPPGLDLETQSYGDTIAHIVLVIMEMRSGGINHASLLELSLLAHRGLRVAPDMELITLLRDHGWNGLEFGPATQVDGRMLAGLLTALQQIEAEIDDGDIAATNLPLRRSASSSNRPHSLSSDDGGDGIVLVQEIETTKSRRRGNFSRDLSRPLPGIGNEHLSARLSTASTTPTSTTPKVKLTRYSASTRTTPCSSPPNVPAPYDNTNTNTNANANTNANTSTTKTVHRSSYTNRPWQRRASIATNDDLANQVKDSEHFDGSHTLPTGLLAEKLRRMSSKVTKSSATVRSSVDHNHTPDYHSRRQPRATRSMHVETTQRPQRSFRATYAYNP